MRKILILAALLALSFSADAQVSSPPGPGPTPCAFTSCSVTTLAIGGAAIGSNALAVTGTANISGSVTGGFFSASTSSGMSMTNNNASFQWRSGGTILFSPASATFQFGIADSASPIAQMLQAQSVVAGNANTSGATFTIAGSKSNGSGGGDVLLQTTLSSASSGVQNALATALTLKGGTQNVITGASLTVTTIGTGTGDFVCAPVGGGLISQGVTTCVASDRRVKNDLGVVTPEKAVARLMAVPDEHLFTYKKGYGPSGAHAGWFAQNIQNDPDFSGTVYRGSATPLTPDGELTFDRAEIGPDTTTAVKWLVAEDRSREAEIAALKAENSSLKAVNDNFNNRLAALEGRRRTLANVTRLRGAR